MVSVSGSWHRAHEILLISWVIRALGACSNIGFWPWLLTWLVPCNVLGDKGAFVLSGFGLASGWLRDKGQAQKDQAMIRSWNFQPNPHFLEKGKGLKLQLNAYMRKPPKSQYCGVKFLVGEFIWEGEHSTCMGPKAPVLGTIPTGLAICTPPGCSSLSFNELVSLSSVSHSSKLSHLRRESWGPLICGQVRQKLGTYYLWRIWSGWEHYQGTEPLTCGI